MVLGIDVSNHQGTIDWDKVVSEGVKFAFLKSSEGTGFIDRYFERNWNECKRVGIARGAYHFARPSQNNSAVSEAYFFLDVVKHDQLEPGDMLVLDMEDDHYPSGIDLSGWTVHFMEVIESIVGFKPLLYTGKWYMDRNLFARQGTRMHEFPLWLSNYQATKPPAPLYWTGYEFWQYTSSGRVYGISGNVDLNDFSGNVEDLAAYGKPTQQEPPPPPYQVDVEAVKAQMEQLRLTSIGLEVHLQAARSEILKMQENINVINELLSGGGS